MELNEKNIKISMIIHGILSLLLILLGFVFDSYLFIIVGVGIGLMAVYWVRKKRRIIEKEG